MTDYYGEIIFGVALVLYVLQSIENYRMQKIIINQRQTIDAYLNHLEEISQ